MAGNIVVHILGDTSNLTRALSRTQAQLSSLRMALTDVNKAASMAGIALGAVAAGGIGAGVVAGGVMAAGFAAAAGAATFLAFQSEEVSKAFEETKETWSSLSAEMTKPMHQPLINFFGTLSDIFENKLGPSITYISQGMEDFLGGLGDHLGPVAEKVGHMLEAAFDNAAEPLYALVDGIGILADGFSEFFQTIDSQLAGDFIRNFFTTISALLPILAQLLNALMPVGNAIMEALIPAFAELSRFISERVVPILDKVTAWLKENPQFVTQLIVAFVALKLAIAAVSGVLGALALIKLAPFIAGIALLGVVLKPLIPLIQEGLNKVMQAFNAELERLKPVINQFVEMLRGHMTKVIEKIIEIMPDLITFIGGLLEALMPIIDILLEVGVMVFEELARVFQELAPVIVEVAKAVSDFLTKAFEENRELIQQFITKLGDMLIALIPLIPKIMDLVLWLGDKLIDGLILVAPYVSDLADQFISIAGEVGWVIDKINEFTTVLDGAVEGNEESKEKLSSIWEEIKTKFVGWIDDLENSSAEGFDTILENLDDWAGDLWDKVYKAMEDAGEAINNKLREWINDMRDKMDEFNDNLLNKLAGLPFDLMDIGIWMVQGFWNGINSIRNWLLDKVSGFANSVLNKIKSTLGIASPSKEMKTVGEWFSEGLAIGIDNESDKVKRAADALGVTAIKAARSSMGEFSGVFSDGLSVRSTVSLDAGLKGKQSGMGSTINLTVEAGISSPEETGRAVVSAIRDFERMNGRQWRE